MSESTSRSGIQSGGDAAKKRNSGNNSDGAVVVSKPNPVHRRSTPEEQGSRRNLWCPLYFECLDVATVNWWRDFSCTRCDNRHLTDKPRADEISSSDVVGWEDIWRGGHLGD